MNKLFREDLVSQMKARVARDDYHPDSESVAGAMLDVEKCSRHRVAYTAWRGCPECAVEQQSLLCACADSRIAEGFDEAAEASKASALDWFWPAMIVGSFMAGLFLGWTWRNAG